MYDGAQTIDFAVDQAFDLTKLLPAIEPYVLHALQAIQGNIETLLPVGAAGDLRRSLTSSTQIQADGILGKIDIKEPARDYAYFAEFGRGPGKMPYSGLGSKVFEWVRVKATGGGGIQAWFEQQVALRKGERKTLRGGDDTRTKILLGMAYVIARSIGRYGSQVHRLGAAAMHPFRDGWNRGQEQFETLVQFGIQKALQTL